MKAKLIISIFLIVTLFAIALSSFIAPTQMCSPVADPSFQGNAGLGGGRNDVSDAGTYVEWVDPQP